MGKKTAVVVLVVLLLVVGGVPLAGGHDMPSCPACLSPSALAGMGLCLAVLAAMLLLVPCRVEWLRRRSLLRLRLAPPALLDRPPRSA